MIVGFEGLVCVVTHRVTCFFSLTKVGSKKKNRGTETPKSTFKITLSVTWRHLAHAQSPHVVVSRGACGVRHGDRRRCHRTFITFSVHTHRPSFVPHSAMLGHCRRIPDT